MKTTIALIVLALLLCVIIARRARSDDSEEKKEMSALTAMIAAFGLSFVAAIIVIVGFIRPAVKRIAVVVFEGLLILVVAMFEMFFVFALSILEMVAIFCGAVIDLLKVLWYVLREIVAIAAVFYAHAWAAYYSRHRYESSEA